MAVLKGSRFAVFVGGFFGVIGLALYPIFISPYFNSDEWKRIQKVNREGIDQDKIQPGNMRIWSNPFEPRKDRKE